MASISHLADDDIFRASHTEDSIFRMDHHSADRRDHSPKRTQEKTSLHLEGLLQIKVIGRSE